MSHLSWTDSITPSLRFSNCRHCISKGSSVQIIKRSQQLSLCRMAAVKRLPVHRYSVVIFTFSDPLGLWDSHLVENCVSLNLGLGGVRDVVSSSISHEQTQSNRVCGFKF